VDPPVDAALVPELSSLGVGALGVGVFRARWAPRRSCLRGRCCCFLMGLNVTSGRKLLDDSWWFYSIVLIVAMRKCAYVWTQGQILNHNSQRNDKQTNCCGCHTLVSTIKILVSTFIIKYQAATSCRTSCRNEFPVILCCLRRNMLPSGYLT